MTNLDINIWTTNQHFEGLQLPEIIMVMKMGMLFGVRITMKSEDQHVYATAKLQGPPAAWKEHIDTQRGTVPCFERMIFFTSGGKCVLRVRGLSHL